MEIWHLTNIKLSFHIPTWVNHHVNGNILFLGHEAQNWEDCEPSNKTGAAVQQTQPQSVPEHTHNHLYQWEGFTKTQARILCNFIGRNDIASNSTNNNNNMRGCLYTGTWPTRSPPIHVVLTVMPHISRLLWCSLSDIAKNIKFYGLVWLPATVVF